MSGWQFWIDRGGTFTDIVARTPDGRLATAKLLSDNPEHYADAAMEGIRRFLDLPPATVPPPGVIDAVKMGTTVATNALLERDGEPTLLAITAGFADALRIGTQNRPDLFARHIVLPEMLYAAVAEMPERVGADGTLWTPLDLAESERRLQAAYDQGLRAIAIVLMHGWRYPGHELQLGALARRIGFTQISLSHQVSPLMKLVPRGDTTVVDAYVGPVLRRHVDRLATALGPTRLMFMQSSGGLTEAARFQGKDSILSGPAGGVVGAVRTAAMAGLTRLVGFDMGGTSTDVCHYDGAYERAEETRVAGARLRAPIMQIHTVAAGGGSILHSDGMRFSVGPDSAGANPGPACYRRGGPLTVTDCNVMLGKLQPDFFPALFGPQGDQPLDRDTVADRFAALAASFDPPADPLALADGYLRIAVENMAHAIRQISIQRGHDISGHALVCFGGAGGQHACLVAETLGMTQVLVHPLAGVLSAYGMGLADQRELRQCAVEEPLSPALLNHLLDQADALIAEGQAALVAQGVNPMDCTAEVRLRLRVQGSDSSLTVDLDTEATIRHSFAIAHRRRYGFAPDPARPLIAEALEVECIGSGATLDEPDLPLRDDPAVPPPQATVPLYSQGDSHTAPVWRRDQLTAGDCLPGPALIIDAISTIVVEAGWQASLNRKGHLLLTRRPAAAAAAPAPADHFASATHAASAHAAEPACDPVRLEIFNNQFMAVAEQMGAVLANTAHSVNIKERLDFSCALFDASGGLIANAPHVPVHLGSMSDSVRAILQRYGDQMQDGDAYVLNAPTMGGTHLPDITVIAPVFYQGTLRFLVGARGHHADIGGITPGSMPPDSTRLSEEGVRLDGLPLVRNGVFQEAILRQHLGAGRWPARNPDQNIADLRAQLAATTCGRDGLLQMLDRYGADMVSAYTRHVQTHAEACVRQVIAGLQDGCFETEMDDGRKIRVALRVNRDARSAVLDFSGTAAQSDGNSNAPLAVTKAAVLYVFRCLVEAPIPLNEGCLAPLTLIVPERSLLNPGPDAAVVAGNVETSQAVVDALMGALGALAGSQGTMNNLTFGNATHQYYETLCGGTGAGPGFPGASGVHSHMTNSRLTDAEVLEWRFPVLLDSFGLRPESGGAGRWPGGNGVIRRLRFLEPMTVSLLSNRRRVAPFGLAGGLAGAVGINRLIRHDGRCETLPGTVRLQLVAGDLLEIATPGGGGYGDGNGDEDGAMTA